MTEPTDIEVEAAAKAAYEAYRQWGALWADIDRDYGVYNEWIRVARAALIAARQASDARTEG